MQSLHFGCDSTSFAPFPLIHSGFKCVCSHFRSEKAGVHKGISNIIANIFSKEDQLWPIQIRSETKNEEKGLKLCFETGKRKDDLNKMKDNS